MDSIYEKLISEGDVLQKKIKPPKKSKFTSIINEINPFNDPWKNEELCECALDKYDRAILHIMRNITDDQKSNEQLHNKIFEIRKKRISTMEKVPSRKCDIGSEYFKLAEQYSSNNHYDNAISSYANAIKSLGIDNIATIIKSHVATAKLYEKQGEYDNALKSYETAYGLHGLYSSTTSYRVMEDIARLNVVTGSYQKALENYEILSQDAIDHPALKYMCKEYLMRAMLCHICIHSEDSDVSEIKTIHNEYKSKYPIFCDTMENSLVENVLDSIEHSDSDKFHESIIEFDKIRKFDTVQEKLLLTIKNKYFNNSLL